MGLEIADLLDRLGAALAPLCALLATSNLTSAKFAQSLAEAFAEIVAAPAREAESAIPGAREFGAWAREITARPGEGPSFAAAGLDSVLFALMAGAEVRNTVHRRDDIAIWGQLEARLQSPDLMILAGLNEDVWPEAADPGPWLSRGMRLAIGLEPPERKQGLAAHDFEMALGNAATLIALAQRLGASPALPSRLVQRLEAFVGEDIAKSLRQRGAQWLAQARAIDAVVETRPARRPIPRPPAKLRPRRLSITEIETLFRSPYDIYAKHVLRLRKLDPLGEEPGGRERGNLIHEVFARFVIDGHDFAAPDALAKLEAMAEKVFSGLDAIGERRDIWLRRFSVAAQGFLDFENERTSRLATRHAEIEGEWTFPQLGGFQLIGRADRIDQLTDGTLEIIDFKTGSIPEPRAMTNFEAPQLPLEAAMAKVGGFKDIALANASALTFIKIGLGPEAFLPFAFKPREDLDLMGAADEVSRRLQGHVSELLLKDVLPMAASIRPDVKRRYRGDYEHLARTDEWALAEGDDSE
jgi:ATP-dependent helicase/nuclease subunit B